MSKDSEMFKLKNVKKATLNDNTTSSKTILNGENIGTLKANRNQAAKINLPQSTEKTKPKKIALRFIGTILTGLILAYLTHMLGWV